MLKIGFQAILTHKMFLPGMYIVMLHLYCHCITVFTSRVKDRQQERTAVLSRSYLNALCDFAPYTLYVYYIYLDSQLITLSIDINIMEIILRNILWLCGKLKNYDY